MVKAVIFDCFGVLTTDSWGPFRRKHFGHDQVLMEEMSDTFRMVDAGLLSYEDFIAKISDASNIDAKTVRGMLDKNIADEQLFDFVKAALKPRYKIGMLSNAGDNWLGQLFTQEQIALFDAVALSYETGFVKPDARAYHALCDRLGVAPEECIFIDDQQGYCIAAEKQGMQAIWYRSFQQFKPEIESLLENTKQR